MNGKLKILVEGALCVALSVALSYIKLFTMPQGGSIHLGMLPIFIFAMRRGGTAGVSAGLVTGILRLFLGGYIVHPVQALLDYPIQCAAAGVAGYFGNRQYLGIAAGTLASLACTVVSGVVFFASYAPKGMNVLLYSLIYNGVTEIPKGALCAVLFYFIWPRLKKIK